MGTKGRWWGPGGDSGDQQRVVGIRREWWVLGDNRDQGEYDKVQEGMMVTRRR